MENLFSPAVERAVDQLMELVETGGQKPLTPLGSEQQLSERLNESGETIRLAVRELVALGVLLQTPEGALVTAPPKLHRNMVQMSSLSQAMQNFHVKLTSRVTESGICEAAKEEASALNLRLGERVFRLTRVRLLDGAPCLIETAFLPAKVFGGLTEFDFNACSLYRVLEEHYGIQAVSQEQEFHLAFPTEHEARLLCVGPEAPLIVQFGRTCDQNGLFFEYSIAKALGSAFDFQSISTRKNEPPAPPA